MKQGLKTIFAGALAALVLVHGGCAVNPPLPGREEENRLQSEFRQMGHRDRDGRLRAGAARREITPPVGTPLSGYARRRGRPSTGVHDPLYVRVLALSDGTDRLILASCDLVAVHQELYERVLEQARSKHGLAPEQLWLAATHNHSGSGALGKRFIERIIGGRFNRKVFDLTAAKIGEAIDEALETLSPASLEMSEARLDGLIENRMIENGPVDEELKVLRVRQDGKTLAWVVNLAAHPTVLNAANFLFSADFPGALAARLEAKSPGSVCLFLNGASGDQRIRGFPGQEGFDRMESIGEALAGKIEGSASALPAAEKLDLVTLRAPLRLPPVKIRRGFFTLPSFIGNRLIPRDVSVNVAALNNVLLISVPGEMTGELGLELKEASSRMGFRPLIAGYTNGYIGYIIPEKYYGSDHYEAGVSFFGPKADRFFKQYALYQIRYLAEAGPSTVPARSENPRGTDAILAKARLDEKGPVPVLFLEGNAYEIGFQHGRLLAGDVRRATDRILGYFPKKLKVPVLGTWITNFLLDRAYRKMKPFIPDEYKEEMRGLADGSGVRLRSIQRVHAIPDLYSTLCSSGAFFGRATRDGRLVQFRNLDWNREIGIQNYACLFVVKKEGKIPFVNIGYKSFLGALSGMNDKGISIAQIGSKSDDETLRGTPMPFVLRKVLEEAGELKDAARIVKEARRTVGYNYVFGDALSKTAGAVETTARLAAFFPANAPAEKESSYALPLDDAVMRSDFALDAAVRERQDCAGGDPSEKGLESPQGSGAYEKRYRAQAEFVRTRLGSLDAPAVLELAKKVAPGSNVQSVVYQYPDFWVANAQGELPAAESGYNRFNLKDLFEKK
ncbi:MAG: neutral/alkaline non-lysosomal ceramidase N-terminal domain-containing protein [Candidatus Omnitrophica bacterium]|nr:neutral/alkaline non-lysosomal ceramidase N-terminal domain-containing protein [Candidatus Omnitrophota bacterium]